MAHGHNIAMRALKLLLAAAELREGRHEDLVYVTHFVFEVQTCTAERKLRKVCDEDSKVKAANEILVDSIVMDCEDGVALGSKDVARDTIALLLDEDNFVTGASEIAVRINPVSSGLAEEDLRAVLETFKAAFGYGPSAPLQLQACILGGDDMAASLGATRSSSNRELSFARGQFLLTCRAAQVQAIDIVKIDLSEAGMQALAAEAKQAAQEGFSGKQVIHPKQVPVVQSAFSPATADIEAAMQLIQAYQDHQQQGQGAFVYQGRMIDAPTVLQARNVLALAERLESLGSI
eukprot:gene2992-3275_t